MLPWKLLFFFGLIVAGAECQILFLEENQSESAIDVPISSKGHDDTSQEVADSSEELTEGDLTLRYGLLASYLDLPPVPDTKPIGAKENSSPLKTNPYLPVKDDINVKQQGNCLCVPMGKCVGPHHSSQYDSRIPRPITDGADLMDVRIVNKPDGVLCQKGLDYCCIDREVYTPAAVSHPSLGERSCGLSNVIPTPEYRLDTTQAKFGEFPWTALILEPTNKFVGGGALVSSRHIITAAHKVANFRAGGLKVRLGEWDAKANIEPLKYVEAVVTRISIYPLFNNVNLQNNIAVLTLDREVDLDANPHINIVCPAQVATNYVNNPRCWVAGWGKDAFGDQGNFQYILKKVNVPVVESNDCENRLRQTKLTRFFQLSRTSFICAGGVAGKDACTGDGGFPLVCERNGRAELVGLVAWGIGCANENVPGVYVNVRSYSEWLATELV